MENISKHITYREATHSQMATSVGYSNIPNSEQLERMRYTAERIFEPVRKRFGVPITVSSFFRTPQVNVLIGGSKTSQHCKGEAMDIDHATLNADIFHFIRENIAFDQLIWEFGDEINPDWVHVSLKEAGNRGQILKSKKNGKQTVYELWNG